MYVLHSNEEGMKHVDDANAGGLQPSNVGVSNDVIAPELPAPAPSQEEYLYLSNDFVKEKLELRPPCTVRVQLLSAGSLGQQVYRGELRSSLAKGYYCLTVPPKSCIAGKDISVIRKQDLSGHIILEISERAPCLQEDLGRRRVNVSKLKR